MRSVVAAVSAGRPPDRYAYGDRPLREEIVHEFKDQDVEFGRDSDQIVMDICGELDIPIISNFPCGHGTYQATLPISVPVELNAIGQKPFLKLIEPAVIKE